MIILMVATGVWIPTKAVTGMIPFVVDSVAENHHGNCRTRQRLGTIRSNISLDLSTSTTWFDIENARLIGTTNLNVTGQGIQ